MLGSADGGAISPEGDVKAYQRASVGAGLPSLLAEFGVDVSRALEGLPLDATVFSDPDRYFPYSWGTRILANCVAATGCRHFGLMLGARTEPSYLGPAGRWLADAPDVRTALSGFEQLQSTNSHGAVFYLRRAAPDFILGYGVYDSTATAHEQAYTLAMSSALNILRKLTDGVAQPSEVLFSFRRPKDIAPYVAHFGAPVRFDQYETGLVFTPAAMQTPISGAKTADFEFWRKRALEAAPPSDRPWTDNVRHVLRPLLLDNRAFAPAAAEMLQIDVRTLGRRLEAEGTNFQRVSDEVRYAIARELLDVTDIRIGDIAVALSYATHGAFVVAFQRWAGNSPSRWRRARREPR